MKMSCREHSSASTTFCLHIRKVFRPTLYARIVQCPTFTGMLVMLGWSSPHACAKFFSSCDCLGHSSKDQSAPQRNLECTTPSSIFTASCLTFAFANGKDVAPMYLVNSSSIVSTQYASLPPMLHDAASKAHIRRHLRSSRVCH